MSIDMAESQWVAPASVAEADERRRDAQLHIEEIQAQLGNRDRRHDYESEAAYESWRYQAKAALRHFSAENRALRDWRRVATRVDTREACAASEAVEMAFGIAHRMRLLVALQEAVGVWLASEVEAPADVIERYRATVSRDATTEGT